MKSKTTAAIFITAVLCASVLFAVGAFADSTDYIDINSSGTSTTNANGTNSIAIGQGAVTSSADRNNYSIAIGYNAFTSSGDSSSNGNLAVGENARAVGGQTVAVGSKAAALGDQSSAFGNNTVALGDGSIAFGGDDTLKKQYKDSSGNLIYYGRKGSGIGINGDTVDYYRPTLSYGTGANAIGVHAQALAQGATAIGAGATAGAATGVLYKTDVKGIITSYSITSTSGENSTALGSLSTAIGDRSTAIGAFATSVSTDSVAIGADSSANARSIAEGVGARATGSNAITMGYYSAASGNNSIAIGDKSAVGGANSLSLGTGNIVSGSNSGAIGDPSVISGDNSYSLGNNNTIATSASNSFVIGNNVNAIAANSVYLGANATAATASGSATAGTESYNQTTIGSTYYGTFAGATPAGVVTVGSAAGGERRIQNVAAGLVSQESTDAINGSQLYAVGKKLDTAISYTINHVASSSLVMFDGTNKGAVVSGDTINDAFEKLQNNTNVASDGNYISSGNDVAGNLVSLDKAIGGKGDIASANVISTDNSVNKNLSSLDAAIGKTKDGTYVSADKTVGQNINALDSAIGSKSDFASTNVISADNSVNKNLSNLDSVIGNTAFSKDTDKSTYKIIGGQTTLTGAVENLDLAATAISNTLDKGITFAGDTGSDAVKLGSKVTVKGADSNITTAEAIASGDSTISIRMSKTPAFTSVTAGTGASQVVIGSDGVKVGGNTYINSNGINANNKTIANVAAGVASGDAVNVGQLYTAINTISGDLKNLPGSIGYVSANKGTYTANASATGSDSAAVGYGSTAAGANSTAVGAGASASGTNSVALGTGAAATAANSVALGANSTTGAAVEDNANTFAINGSTYTSGTGTGRVAAGTTGVVSVGSSSETRQLQNVSNGQVTKDSTDAVNGSQLYAVVSSLAPTADGTYTKIKTSNTVGGNLAALDAAIGSASDFTSTNYIGSGSSVNANLSALDSKLKNVSDSISSSSSSTGGSTVTVGGSSTTSVVLADNARGATGDATTASELKTVLADNAKTVVDGADLQKVVNLGLTVAANAKEPTSESSTASLQAAAQDGSTGTYATAKAGLGTQLNIVGDPKNTTSDKTGYSSQNLKTFITTGTNDVTVEVAMKTNQTLDSLTVGSSSASNKVVIDDNGVDMGGKQIANVASGGAISASNTNAINGADLYNYVGGAYDDLDDKLSRVGAGAAAIAGLHPLDFDPDSKLSAAIGFGGYRDKYATAAGLFYRPKNNIMYSIGATIGNGDNMYNAGLAFVIGGNKHEYVKVSQTEYKQMAETITTLQQQLDELKAQIQELKDAQNTKK